MPSYFSSLLTTTTSRVATLRANLLPNENDGDTQDDTHLCRVLRAYYTEKGRSFPAWLPPDPKLPPPVVVQPAMYTPGVGSSYGNLNQTAGGTALSSLWDSQPPSAAGSSSTSQTPSSRGPTASPAPRQSAAARQNPFTRQQQQQRSHSPQSQVLARPLPSQREGSYQTISRAGEQPPGSPGGQYTSAKDRLRKLARPKVETPRGSDTSGQSVQSAQSARSNGYFSSAQPTSSTSNYEDRFAPPEGGYAGVRTRVSEKPFVAATSPWATTENEFSGGGYGYNSGSQSATATSRPGLPNNPAAGRRGAGASNGPGRRQW